MIDRIGFLLLVIAFTIAVLTVFSSHDFNPKYSGKFVSPVVANIYSVLALLVILGISLLMIRKK